MSSGRVFLVDDDASILRAFSRLLKSDGYDVDAFRSAEDFLEHHDGSVPGCAIIDIWLGTCNGLDLMRTLMRTGQMRPTIITTGFGDIPTSVDAMRSGAINFLTKPVQGKDLFEAVHEAIERDSRDREQHAKVADIADQLSSLTPRECEVLTQVVAGRRNKQIAYDLGISEKTVKVHRGRVMTKMNVYTVAALVRIVEPGWVRAVPEKSGSGKDNAQQRSRRSK